MVEWHVFLSVPVVKTTARMGRKSARVRPVAKIAIDGAVISGNSRSCATRIPVQPICSPPSVAGCLFLGFDNSVIGGCAERFDSATHKPAKILGTRRAGIFQGFQGHMPVCAVWCAGSMPPAHIVYNRRSMTSSANSLCDDLL